LKRSHQLVEPLGAFFVELMRQTDFDRRRNAQGGKGHGERERQCSRENFAQTHAIDP
jgi:hypothetical protein